MPCSSYGSAPLDYLLIILLHHTIYFHKIPGYTLNELPHTASALTLAATLWEKIANGGILVIIEPGTPDGFNSIRAVREMLIECCPIKTADGHDQCHIIAPCTHTGR